MAGFKLALKLTKTDTVRVITHGHCFNVLIFLRGFPDTIIAVIELLAERC